MEKEIDMSQKIIVTNRSALRSKYQATGLGHVDAAIAALVAADAKRGITTTTASVDNPALGSAAVKTAHDPAENKAAIDAIFKKTVPDYLMILGASDVIPHQDLANPCNGGTDDPDAIAFGDLPYACAGAYSKTIAKFVNPTRVVGRLPDLIGATSPDYLVKLLTRAANYTPRRPADYATYLGVSAQVWCGSTSQSLSHIFGSASTMKTSPSDGPNWTQPQLQALAHFFNCHGAEKDSHFYGQDSPTNYPVAHDASLLVGRLAEGTIASCECCYGAALYDPHDPTANGQLGMANTYLQEGAYGYCGSTTVAYGPAQGNANADLICQYFLESVLKGASLGRAMLEARQKYLGGWGAPTPFDYKTLAQFLLLGDPSIQPVESPPTHVLYLKKEKGIAGIASMAETLGHDRALRRARLAAAGEALAANAMTTVEWAGAGVPDAVKSLLSERAKATGAAELKFKSFEVQPPAAKTFTKSLAKTRMPRVLHIATGRLPGRRLSLVVYIAVEDQLGLSVRELYSR
jgi:hypothetical protein